MAVNATSSLLSCLSMPVVFGIYSKATGTEFPFSVPAVTLVGRLILLVAIPIAGGMGLRAIRTVLANEISQKLKRACVAGVLFFCIVMMGSRYEQIRADWRAIFLASVSLIVVAFVVGWAIGLALRLKRPEVITLAILLPVRNVGLAVTIAVTLMDRLEYVVLATVYFLTETFFLLGFAVLFGISLGGCSGGNSARRRVTCLYYPPPSLVYEPWCRTPTRTIDCRFFTLLSDPREDRNLLNCPLIAGNPRVAVVPAMDDGRLSVGSESIMGNRIWNGPHVNYRRG